jgi:hypothetical protein
MVAKNPLETTFCFEPGTYSRQEIVPKDYDSFIALQPRTAILNGANLLTSFTEETVGGILIGPPPGLQPKKSVV